MNSYNLSYEICKNDPNKCKLTCESKPISIFLQPIFEKHTSNNANNNNDNIHTRQ